MPSLNTHVARGLKKVFSDGGQQATWYRYSGTANGSPQFGIQGAAVYATAAASIIQSRRTTRHEAQVAGGQLDAGMIPIFSRQEFGKEDRIRFDARTYTVDGHPLVEFLGGTQFFKINLKPI